MKHDSKRFSPPVSRRVLLRTAAGGALALPLLDSLVAPEARAANAPIPKRLVLLFTPNGTIAENYFGSGDGASFQPGSIFQPLVDAGHKNDLLILDNINENCAIQAYGDAHGVGMGCLLTGKKLRTGEDFGAGMGGPGSGWPDNESIDQLIARNIGTTTQLGSLELAGKRAPGNIWTRMSYKGSANPVSPMEDPQAAFDRVFKPLGDDMTAAARLVARRRSVLENSVRELRALDTKISAEDREKIGVHLATLEDLQARLSTTPPTNQCTTAPMRPTVTASPEVIKNPTGMEVINANNDRTFPQIISAQLDILAGALACDVTRVASLLFCPSRSDVVMTWAPLMYSESHHEVSHFGDTEKDSKAKLVKMNQWYAQQIASFVTKLKSIPEGTGSVFSNTLIVWINELGIGNSHSHTRLPFAIIGSGGGHFRTGRTVRFSTSQPHNNLLVSIANAMGVQLPGGNLFGDPMYCTGPLAGLTA